MRPVIGITPCSRVDDYVESVKRAGGEPIVLSNADDPHDVLSRVHGVLLTGGADVDPALYGQAVHETTDVQPERDAFEIPLVREAIGHDVPLFAICRGVQVLNVAAGGTLVQDIPSMTHTAVNHAIEVPKHAPAHTVRVVPGSALARALAASPAVESCTVNSRHHQAIAGVAQSFVVSAVAPDGLIEAIERPDAAFCIGVQWHPENYWRTGEFAPLFAAFVQAAQSSRHD